MKKFKALFAANELPTDEQQSSRFSNFNDKIKLLKKQKLLFLVSLLFLTACTGTMPDLGVTDGKFKECPESPNCVNSQAQPKDEEHFIKPINIKATSQETKEYILVILEELKESKLIEEQSNYIRAEFVSRIFRLVDDVEFYFPETQMEETTIHVRSASRLGYSDLGVNRKRVENLRTKITESVK